MTTETAAELHERMTAETQRAKARSQSVYDQSVIAQATEQPRTVSTSELYEHLRLLNKVEPDYFADVGALRNFLAARRLVGGHTREDIAAAGEAFAKSADEARQRADAAYQAVGDSYAKLAHAEREMEELAQRWKKARQTVNNPRSTDDEREKARELIDEVGDMNPEALAVMAYRERIAFANCDSALRARQNDAAWKHGEPLRVYDTWLQTSTGQRNALNIIDSATPYIAGLAAQVASPQPTPERTPAEEAEAVATMARKHRQEIETIQTEMAGTPRKGRK